MRTRVKICGITRQEDALAAVEQGADAIGLVFYSKSPRFVSMTDAQVVVERMPPFVCKVGLFVDAPQAQVEETLQSVQLDLLQFHGDESPDYCRQFHVPYIKALRMRDNMNVVAFAQEYADASGVLLDTYQPGVAGGTGQAFDWSRIPQDVPAPIILAGGLTPANVASAIEQVQPYAVDVSGGVEVSKGIKDADKIAAFMQEVNRVSN